VGRDDAKVERNGKIRLSACQVHNRRLSEFRIKRSISKVGVGRPRNCQFVMSGLKLMSAEVGVVHNKVPEAQPL
jgi:hypothetical protein